MKPHAWLWPLSIPYRIVVGIRNRLYDAGVLLTHKVEAPVISVGNISVGGTGKTPFVAHLVELLRQSRGEKLKMGVVSRGYKGNRRGSVTVSDGRNILATPDVAGDEPVMIATTIPRLVVVVDKDRVRGAKVTIDEHRVRAVIMDDGFQHRRLRRDLDIVLLDARNPLGNRMTLPAGVLREPVSSLSRADLIVLSKAVGSDDDLASRCDKLGNLLKKPVIATRLVPRYWRRLDGSELVAADQVAGIRTLAFAGIANPDTFFDTVHSLNADLKAEIGLPDHCRYGRKIIDRIGMAFKNADAEWLVTTAKDAVKIPPIMRLLPIYQLEIGLEIAHGADTLEQKLTDLFIKPE